MYVLDSSVFASILVKDEFYSIATEFVRRHLKEENITFELAFIEVANVLWKHTFILKRISKDKYKKLRSNIKSLISNIAHVYSSADILEEATDNAVEFGISVYDSLFVTLALSKKYKLVSFDEKLKKVLVEKGLREILMEL